MRVIKGLKKLYKNLSRYNRQQLLRANFKGTKNARFI